VTKQTRTFQFGKEMAGPRVKTNTERWHLKKGGTASLNSLPEDIIDSKFYTGPRED